MPFSDKSFRAIVWLFFMNGALFASFATNIPFLKLTYALGEAAIGQMLFALAAGSVVFMVLSGALTARFGSRAILRVSTLMMPPFLMLVFWGNPWALHIIVIIGFGAAMGTMDVAMNQQSGLFEAQRDISVMSSMHGFFSLGALTGALSTWISLANELDPIVQMAIMGSIGITGAVFAFRHMLDEATQTHDGPQVNFFRGLKNIHLMFLSLLSFLAMLTEGAANDWSPLYLIEFVPTTPDKGALGFAAFAGSMVVGRFSGDWATRRFGRQLLVIGGGILIVLGCAIFLSAAPMGIKFFGLALAGLGVANLVPAVFSTAAALPGLRAGVGIAYVSILGYAGFLIGPPTFGFLAEHFGLDRTLWLLVIAGAFFAVAGPAFTRR